MSFRMPFCRVELNSSLHILLAQQYFPSWLDVMYFDWEPLSFLSLPLSPSLSLSLPFPLSFPLFFLPPTACFPLNLMFQNCIDFTLQSNFHLLIWQGSYEQGSPPGMTIFKICWGFGPFEGRKKNINIVSDLTKFLKSILEKKISSVLKNQFTNYNIHISFYFNNFVYNCN